MGKYAARQGEPGMRIRFGDAQGQQHELRADDDGRLHPRDASEEAWLGRLGLPVAKKEVTSKTAGADTPGKEG